MDKTLIQALRRLILTETLWLRHYIGKVEVVENKDDKGKGMLKVSVEALSITKENGLWCFPRDKNSMSLPKQGDFVEIYFINGDQHTPVYMGGANEMDGMPPKNYKDEKTHVLFEDPESDKGALTYKSGDKQFDMLGTKFTVFGDALEVDC